VPASRAINRGRSVRVNGWNSPAANTHLQLFLQAVALDLMQVDDPRLYEMIATKEAIFAWEIKSRANVVRCILFGCVQTELKRSRHAHVSSRSHCS
jgi:hypothetical protein